LISTNDVIELPPGVTVEASELIDHVRGIRIGLNTAAAVALHESTPARMAAALCSCFSVERTRADADALTLCASLNAALLANIRVAWPRLLVRWVRDALILASLRRLPAWPARRRAVRTSSVTAALTTVAHGTAGTATVVSLATALPLASAGTPILGCAVGLAAGAGLVLHEVGHAIALRGIAAALIVRGVRVSLLHPKLDPRRQRLVAACGPLAVIAAALVTLVAMYVFATAAGAAVALILALHALSLTVLSPDGRKLCVVC
jgi:hypothetical protein